MILAAAESLLNLKKKIYTIAFLFEAKMRSFLSIVVLCLSLLCDYPLEANAKATFVGITVTHQGTTTVKIRVSYIQKIVPFFKGKRLTPFQPQKDIYVNIFEAIVGAIFSPLISVRELIKKLTMPDYETNVRLYLNLTNFLHLLIVPGGIEK